MRRPAIAPVRWRPPPRLAGSQRLPPSMPSPRLLELTGSGPEDVVVDAAGRLITGLEDGRIVRLTPDGTSVQTVADTGGHPLGVEIDSDGSLVVCDCTRGLLRVDPSTGDIHELIAADVGVAGQPLRLTNNAAVGRDGTIWFSDSSARFAQPFWKADLLEHSGTGRLIRRDPDGSTEVVLNGLQFANGVALSSDESFVVVAETGGYRLTRLWVHGPRVGTSELLVELPGFPDNISVGTDGLLWVALGSPRNPVLDALGPRNPLLRRAIWALPDQLQPKPANTAWTQAYTFDGALVHDFRATVARFRMVTGVREHRGTVYLSSLRGRCLAAFEWAAE